MEAEKINNWEKSDFCEAALEAVQQHDENTVVKC
jgi:hypothetical protein